MEMKKVVGIGSGVLLAGVIGLTAGGNGHDSQKAEQTAKSELTASKDKSMNVEKPPVGSLKGYTALDHGPRYP